MAQKTERTKNTSDTATVTTVALNTSTATTILAANENRKFVHISINGGSGDEDVYIRLYAAATDNTKHGIWIGRHLDENGSYFNVFWEMPPDNIYTGEISGITSNGGHTVQVTEY